MADLFSHPTARLRRNIATLKAISKGTYEDFISPLQTVFQLPALLRRSALLEFGTPLPSLAKYKYTPLEPNEIRVLVLRPGLLNQDLHCTLEVVSLNELANYEALSYSWGDPSQTLALRCDDGTLNVTVNLHSALRHLRHVYRKRRLWADAICINQGDLREQTHQVQRMGDIYAMASRVLVWLGDDTGSVPEAFEALKLTRALFLAENAVNAPIKKSFWRLHNRPARLQKFLASGEGKRYIGMFEPVKKMLLRPWFTRKWVIQEVVRGKNGLLVCGSYTLPWQTLEDAIIYLRDYDVLSTFYTRIGTLGPSALDSIPAIAVMRHRLRLGEKVETLETLLYYTRKLAATKPRDHVISLLGLVKDVNSHDLTLLVDYSTPDSDYAPLFVSWSITKWKALHCLSSGFEQANIADPSRPSWIPNFNLWNREHSTPRSLMKFRATLELEPLVSFDSGWKRMAVTGTVIDKIAELGSVLLDADSQDSLSSGDEERPIRNLLGWIKECKAIAPDLYSQEWAPEFELFWRTLIWDSVWDDSHFDLSMQNISRGFADCISYMESHPRDWQERILKKTNLAVLSALGKWAEGRRFCRTEGGRLGSMPRHAHVGDKICLFYGGYLPYVIRPCGDGTYTYVGDCYVHGVMYGEAIGWKQITEEFTLV